MASDHSLLLRNRLRPAPSKEAALRASAKSALQGIVIEHFGAAGNEEMVVTKVVKDKVGAFHVRFEQEFNGMPVAGAGMVLHAHAVGEEIYNLL